MSAKPTEGSGRFAGRVIVVTGAAGDLGRATAERFAREGARVAAIDLPDRPLDACVAAVESAGSEALAATADVTRAEELERALAAAVERFGGIDFLFNNAGIEGHAGHIEQCAEEDFDRVIATNVKGVFLGVKLALPHLRHRGGGVIVSSASIAGVIGNPWLPAYAAAKHAVLGLTRSVAASHGHEGIRVVAVCPGPIEGRMMGAVEAELDSEDPSRPRAAMTALIPQGRYGRPEEVAGLVAFLCSDDAAYLHGTGVILDGGMLATVG